MIVAKGNSGNQFDLTLSRPASPSYPAQFVNIMMFIINVSTKYLSIYLP